MREKVKVLIVPALAIATLLIFCLDLVTPLGVVDWALYSIPLLLTLWAPHRYAMWVVAAIASALTVLGGLYSPSGVIPDPFAFFNRTMGIGFIWASALIIMHRKRVEEALRDSEAQFRAMFDNSPTPVFFKDTEGRYFHINRRFEETFHISNEAIAGKTDDQVFPPEQAAAFRANDLKVLRTGISLQFEAVLLHDDGPHTSLVFKFPLRHGDRRLYAIGGIAIDITDRKRTEEARARLAAIVESSEDAIISLSRDGSILSWNLGAETIFGYTAEEIIGKPAVVLCPPERLAEIPEFTERLRRENRLDCFETVRRRKDGREIHVSLRLSPIKDETGRITGISEIVRDITERKLSEELIWIRTRQQAAVAELGQRALASTDLSALMNDAASLVARTLCTEFSKVLEVLPDGARLLLRAGVGWQDGLVGYAIVEASDTQAGYTLARNSPVVVDDLRTETRFTGPPLLHDHGVVSGVSVIIQGERRPFGVLGAHTSRQRIFTHDDAVFLQNVANVLAHALQRKRAEEALCESVTRLRTILDSEPACVSTMAFDGALLTMNRAGLAMIGAESERDVIGTKIFDLIHPDDRSVYQHFHDRVCQGQAGALQFRIKKLRGGERWLETHAAPIPGVGDMNPEVVGVTQDITEGKRAKEALAQALQGLHDIMETVPDVVYVLNRQGNLVKWNKKLEHVTGLRADELYERSALAFFPDEDKPHIASKIQEAFTDGYAEAEGRLLTKSGTAIPHYWTGAVMKNVQGDIIGLTGIGRDITERKRGEEALRNAHAELEMRVQERTSDLMRANAQLQQEIAERQRAEEALGKSLEEVRDLYNNAPCGYHSLDENGIFVAINDTELRWFGYQRDEVVGKKSFCDLTTPAGREVFYDLFALFKERGWVRDLEFDMVRKDGTIFPVLISAIAVKDASGNYLHSRSTMFDITEYKQAEEKFRLVVESAPWGILMANTDGRIIMVNLGLERLFGYVREELIGRPLEMLIPERFRHRHRNHRAGFFVSPRARPMGANMDLYGLRKDGSEFPVEVTLTPVQTKDGPMVVSAIVDLTERKRAQEEIQKHTRLLEAANKELEAFSYSVSHDLRAPLRSINGFSTALLQDYHNTLDERGREDLQRVRAATQRMDQLINDLLDLSRVTRSPLSYEMIDLSAMVETVMEDLRQRQPDRQVDVVVTPDLIANGDARLLRVVLENLLGNAWKFTARRACGRIEFGTWQNATERAYFVRDNGAGFDMAYVGKLFGAFQRLHTLAEFPGTGIGLATVQRIVHRHGGRVWAEGAVDHGATFYFTL